MSGIAKPSFTIIGAGVVGMTMASGMYSRSIPNKIFEKRDSLTKYPNFRITINDKGVKSLQKILPKKTFGDIMNSTITTKTKYKYLQAKDLRELREVKELNNIYAISSSKMMEIISSSLPSDYVNYNSEFNSFQTNEKIISIFKDKKTTESDFMIASDGVETSVRGFIAPDEATDSGFRYVEGELDSSFSPKITGLIETPVIAVSPNGYAITVFQMEEVDGLKTRWRLSYLDETFQGRTQKKSMTHNLSILKEYCLENMANWSPDLTDIVDKTPIEKFDFPKSYLFYLPRKMTKKNSFVWRSDVRHFSF